MQKLPSENVCNGKYFFTSVFSQKDSGKLLDINKGSNTENEKPQHWDTQEAALTCPQPFLSRLQTTLWGQFVEGQMMQTR